MKLIHIHTDPKFFRTTKRFISPDFNNVNIYIGEETKSVLTKLKNQHIVFDIYPKNGDSIKKIIRKYGSFDGAVLYDLDSFKIKFLERSPKEFKCLWFLFGYEIYQIFYQDYISKATLNIVNPITLKHYGLKRYIKKKIKRELGIIPIPSINKYEEIYKKVDGILILCKQEYDELTKLIKLPPFIQRSIGIPIEIRPQKKSNQIIVGNSAHKWNNHLDILKIINPIKNIDIKYIFFFSYGNTSNYSKVVKKKCVKNKNIQLLDQFLDIEEFNKVYDDAAALVINSFRQHAVGNILTGIRKGVKVYLNPRSSTYWWLIDEGFLIYTIKDLKKDIKRKNIYLSDIEQIHNMEIFQQLHKKYSKKKFLEDIRKVLEI